MLAGYLSLFFTSLIAATLFPMGSELVLIGLIKHGWPVVTTVAVASVGNVLGSAINYVIGYLLHQGFMQTRLKVYKANLIRAEAIFRKFGRWTLLFAWLPIIGDPLTLFAGLSRVNFGLFLLLVSVGKVARYAVIATSV